MRQLKILNPENVTEEEISNYPIREAARAIVIDNKGLIALLHVTRDNYYKIPGGGIEASEDKITALKRECLEEIGCNIEVIQELGMIKEYRKMFNMTQISYCYLVKLSGKKGSPHYMEDELEEGFEPIWLQYQDALKLIKNNKGIDPEARDYMVPRDTIFLETAKDLLLNR